MSLENINIDVIPYILLLTTIISFFFDKSKKISIVIFAGSLLSAMYFSKITIVGFFAIITFIAIAGFNYSTKVKSKYLKAVIWFIFILSSLALMSHTVPGFNNIMIYKGKISEHAVTYSFWVNYDKPLIALVFLLFNFHPIKFKVLAKKIRQIIPYYIICASFLCLIAFISKIFLIDLTVFNYLWLWIPVNLVLVCIAEEVLFRGEIQQKIYNLLKGNNASKPVMNFLPIVISSVLFGLAHYNGGIVFIALATICGFFYGLFYHKTKRIEASIIIHFLLNLTHILFFTYPMLERTYAF